MDAIRISRDLAAQVDGLKFGDPSAFVYNPLIYARNPHEQYLERYASHPVEVVLLGMNPGPFGMAQTGVPFGEVNLVRGWLKIDGPVGKPPREHPRRPVLGFACSRSEVSGARLWGWARQTFSSPERFFSRFFVANYCPLLFLESSGCNLTPDKLAAAERRVLFERCDDALSKLVELLEPRWVLGVGKFAEDRARTVLAGQKVAVGRVPHPSPASPTANRGWARQVDEILGPLGLLDGVRLPG